MSALFYTAQAFVCAMIFEFGHEAGLYPALLVELRTVACNSLQVGRWALPRRARLCAARALTARLGRLRRGSGSDHATMSRVLRVWYAAMYTPGGRGSEVRVL